MPKQNCLPSSKGSSSGRADRQENIFVRGERYYCPESNWVPKWQQSTYIECLPSIITKIALQLHHLLVFIDPGREQFSLSSVPSVLIHAAHSKSFICCNPKLGGGHGVLPFQPVEPHQASLWSWLRCFQTTYFTVLRASTPFSPKSLTLLSLSSLSVSWNGLSSGNASQFMGILPIA